MICVASGSATCPSGNDWADAAVWIALIFAIAGYKYNVFRLWVNRHKVD